MGKKDIVFTVFTKPWHMPLPELGKFIKDLGFDGIELPIRPNYQVEPEKVEKGLPEAVKILADFGLKIASIAGPVDEKTIGACAEAGIPVIRTIIGVMPNNYMDHESEQKRRFDTLLQILEKTGVTIGVQNHYDFPHICTAMALHHLVEKYNPKNIGVVLDFAHCALGGEHPELAVDLVWSHLCMVNLKNVFWYRANGPEAEVAEWGAQWTSGRHGLASWSKAAEELKKRDYKGVVCLTAEYSDQNAVDRLIKEDIEFAKSLF
ncbi:MAG: sugar phosphate isomerase/epimerase family protein [Candidatus Theseobacter exili]|nr:sugar phosphate isomerase/epimerase family protein [Candidatus Theseobacter exili]